MAKSLTAQKTEAEIAAFKAQEAREKRQAELFRLQTEVIRRDIAAEDAETLNQRIFPFTSEVRQPSITECIDQLSEWRHKSSDPITIQFTSPGGLVMPGLALFDYILSLRDEGITVNTVALGEAASMAGILLQAGTKRYIGPNTYVLIHEVSSGAIGKTSELEDEVAFTRRLQNRLVGILAERSTMKVAAIKRRWKKTDWWLEPEEVVRLGFADAIYRGQKARRGRR